jgi:hypothetical protein
MSPSNSFKDTEGSKLLRDASEDSFLSIKVPESLSRRVLQRNKKRAASTSPLRNKTPKALKPLPFKPTKPLKNKEPKPVTTSKRIPTSKWKQQTPSKSSRKTKESSQSVAQSPKKDPHLLENKRPPFRSRNQEHRTFRRRNQVQ